MKQRVIMIRSYEVPYLAGYSKDGKHFYVDKRLPLKLKLKDGRVIPNVDKYLLVHEETEKKLEDEKGYRYQYAHEQATKAERRAVEADGIPWKEYQDYMLGEVKRLTELTSTIPNDIDTKPEHDTGDRTMLETIIKQLRSQK